MKFINLDNYPIDWILMSYTYLKARVIITYEMKNTNNNTHTHLAVGILGWEARNNNALSQLGHIPGDIAHPSTFSFPVLYKQIEGAYYETVIVEPSTKVLRAMINAAKEMEKNGVKAIMTDCGYNVFSRS
ncbi:MAG: hypothetical protein KAG43_05240 [Candidatus Marithrix sp.]|nr:hypothetical protein [Candidatus Marithrix sp.]